MGRKRKIAKFREGLSEFNRPQLFLLKIYLEEQLKSETLEPGEGLPRPWRFLSRINRRGNNLNGYDHLALSSLPSALSLLFPAVLSGVGDGGYSLTAFLLMALSPAVLIPANGLAALGDRVHRKNYAVDLESVEKAIEAQSLEAAAEPTADDRTA